MSKQPEIKRPSTTPDGHVVGDDGFVVPKDFLDFHERYPKFIQTVVKMRMYHATDADRAQRVLQLKRFLLAPPTGSIFVDRIAMFDPERRGDVSGPHFFSFVYGRINEAENEQQLSLITAPPATVRCHRRVTRVRLWWMQRELIEGNIPISDWTDEINAEGEND